MHIVVLREAGIIVRVGSNKTGYWKINIYNYGTAHYGGAFLFGNATKRPIPQTTKRPIPLFGIVLLERQGKGVCGDKIATRSDIMAEKGLRHVI